ncbi:hypothetical protein CYANOKiyG1_65150 [Okeania sp. KiyG1]|nr:hypothetical protein CYANOKiyG1_65150 [Okeania sp. KiyG1]
MKVYSKSTIKLPNILGLKVEISIISTGFSYLGRVNLIEISKINSLIDNNVSALVASEKAIQLCEK